MNQLPCVVLISLPCKFDYFNMDYGKINDCNNLLLPYSIFFAFIIFCMLASSIYDYVKTKKGGKKNALTNKRIFNNFMLLFYRTQIPIVPVLLRPYQRPQNLHC